MLTDDKEKKMDELESVKWPFKVDGNHLQYYGLYYIQLCNIETELKENNCAREGQISSKDIELKELHSRWYNAYVNEYAAIHRLIGIGRYSIDGEPVEYFTDDIEEMKVKEYDEANRNFIRFTNELFGFINKLTALGNVFELKYWDAGFDPISPEGFYLNGKLLIAPRKDYLNFIHYLITNGYEVKGVELKDTEPVFDDNREKIAKLEREIIFQREEYEKNIAGAEYHKALENEAKIELDELKKELNK